MMNGWQTVPLGEVANRIERAEVPMAGTTYRQVGVRLWGQGAYERETIDGSQTKYATLSRVESGDIIVNKIWARNGSVAVVSDKLSGCFGSGEFPTFAPDRKRLDPRWFHWMTKTKWLWQACDEKSQGTSGKNRIRPEKFLEIEIPLPPLDEQRRLVERVEALTVRIAKAHSLREEAGIETESFISHSLKHLLKSKENWKTKAIAEVSTMSTGTTPPSHQSDYYGGNIIWYTPGDLGSHKELGKSTRTLSELAVQDKKARIFQPGTILLVAIGGSIGKVGLTRIECSSNQQITGILFHPEIFPDYGFWWMRRLYDEIRAIAPQATLPIINQQGIGRFDISYPSLDEQKQIVSYLDGLQAQQTQLLTLQEETQKELDALLPSILNRAFNGEL